MLVLRAGTTSPHGELDGRGAGGPQGVRSVDVEGADLEACQVWWVVEPPLRPDADRGPRAGVEEGLPDVPERGFVVRPGHLEQRAGFPRSRRQERQRLQLKDRREADQLVELSAGELERSGLHGLEVIARLVAEGAAEVGRDGDPAGRPLADEPGEVCVGQRRKGGRAIGARQVQPDVTGFRSGAPREQQAPQQKPPDRGADDGVLAPGHVARAARSRVMSSSVLNTDGDTRIWFPFTIVTATLARFNRVAVACGSSSRNVTIGVGVSLGVIDG